MVKHSSAALDRVFHALADPTRRAMLQRIAGGDCSVSDLAQPFNMSLAAVSKHITVLESAGLLRRKKEGRTSWCSLEPKGLRAAEAWLRYYEKFWNTRLDALESILKKSKMTKGGRRHGKSPTGK